MSIETALSLVSVVLGPIIIGLFFQAFEARRECSREATELFHRYNSPEILAARDHAWNFLSSSYAARPLSWHLFYSDGMAVPGIDRKPLQAVHADIVMVATTWALLAVMINEKRVDKRLARMLFGIQYSDWGVAFRQVRDVTIEAGRTPPEWTTLLSVLDRHLLPASAHPLSNALPRPVSELPVAAAA